jgi:hypothetical protein
MVIKPLRQSGSPLLHPVTPRPLCGVHVFDINIRNFSDATCITAAVMWGLSSGGNLIRLQNVASGSFGTIMRGLSFIEFAKLTFLQWLG